MGSMITELVTTVGLLRLVVGVVGCAQSKAVAGPGEAPMPNKTIEQVLQEQTNRLMALPGVVGTAMGLCAGEPCIKVFVVEKTGDLLTQIPTEIEGYQVAIDETGEIKALDEVD